jgi:crossover junction endodeoxyribonuclease RuvC
MAYAGDGSNVIILGIDPGLQNTGWGVVSIRGNNLSYVSHGIVKTEASDLLPSRLSFIGSSLKKVIETYAPHEAAVEEIFVNKNPASALKLGMARGVSIMIPASYGIDVFEYGANRVKKMIVGAGHADKSQVATMVMRFLPGAGLVSKDAADALAVAICHCYNRSTNYRLGVNR